MTLANKVQQFSADADLVHSIVHGANNATVLTEGGAVPTLPKVAKDAQDQFAASEAQRQADFEGARQELFDARDASATSAANASISASIALASGKVFNTTAAGIAGTASGQVFLLATGNLQVYDLYLNSAGVAALQGQFKVASSANYKTSNGRDLEEWRDALGRVYGRISSAGMMYLTGLAGSVQSNIKTLLGLVNTDALTDVLVVRDSAGKKMIRMRGNGKIHIPRLAKSLQDTIADLQAQVGSLVFFPETYGAVGDGVTDDSAAFQACADAIAAAGGGIMQLSGKTYVIGKPVYIHSNTIVQGMGMGRTRLIAKAGGITYGPLNTFAPLWLADSVNMAANTTTAPSNAMVRDLRVTPLESVYGATGYALPITAGVFLGRLAAGSIAKNVGVERVWVDDCGFGVGMGQRGTPTAAVPTNQLHQNLWVRDCRVDGSRNKAIELQQTFASTIISNRCFGCNHGPQFIHENQYFAMVGNFVEFNDYGIGLANASNVGVVADNVLRFSGNFPSIGGAFPYNYASFSAYPAGFNFKTDADVAYAGNVYIQDVEFSNNVVDMTARVAGDGRAWSFGGNAASQNIVWRRFTFKGDKYINCKPQIGRGIENAPSSYTISAITLDGCTMPGFIGSDAANVSDVLVKGGRVTAAQTLDNATGWTIKEVHFTSTLTLSNTTNGVKAVLNTLPAGAASITNNGAGNTVAANY